MLNKDKFSQRHINFPLALEKEIEAYARQEDLNFSEAVRQMCESFLLNKYDRNYAPAIGQMIERSNDRLIRRISYLLDERADLEVD